MLHVIGEFLNFYHLGGALTAAMLDIKLTGTLKWYKGIKRGIFRIIG